MLFPPNFCKTGRITSLTLLIETFMARRSMITSRTSSTYLSFSNVVMVSSLSKQVSCSNSLFFSLSSPALYSSFKIMAALCSFNKSSSLVCMLLCFWRCHSIFWCFSWITSFCTCSHFCFFLIIYWLKSFKNDITINFTKREAKQWRKKQSNKQTKKKQNTKVQQINNNWKNK